MLTGVLIWAGGHLLANGDNKSLILFGGLGLWALVSIITVSRNEGIWVKPARIASVSRELLSVVIAATLYAVLMFVHPWIAGVPVVLNIQIKTNINYIQILNKLFTYIKIIQNRLYSKHY